MKYLTNEQRKEKYVEIVNHFTFESCIDLSVPVKVHHFKPGMEAQLAQEVGCFIGRWLRIVHPQLNGFPGLDTVKYELIDD